jgi:GT2 family glycosyltransferase
MADVLIGTPMHVCKDYAFKRWLDALEAIEYPVREMLWVDNSPGLDYYEYLKANTPKNIKTTVIHIDITYHDPEERVGIAREEIRKKVLEEGFDWWFSWEADTIAPPDVITKMMKYSDEFKVIHHASPSRQDPDTDGNSFGLSLIHRDILARFGFALEWGNVDPLMPHCWHGVDSWFNRRVCRDPGPDGKFIELYGVVKPLLHLNE